MKTHERSPILDSILENWWVPLDHDFVAYKNHCYRVLNFCLALCLSVGLGNRKIPST